MKNNFIVLIVLIVFCLFVVTSCDILRSSLFEVLSWSPGEGLHSEPEKITVSLNFSHEPNKESIERNFSLTGDGNLIRGTFRWELKKVIFTPLSPLNSNADYTINLLAGACNTSGLNMDKDFIRIFTTRAGNNRPFIDYCYPEMYEEIDNLRTEVRLVFSSSVPIKALYDNVSFVPSISGFWQLEENGRNAVFTPSEPWKQNCRYEIRVSSSFTDANGMNLRNDFISIFTTETDRENPELLFVYRVTNKNEYHLLSLDNGYAGIGQMQAENHGWEKDDKFLLVFSKPVDSISVKNCLTAENAPNLIIETPPGFNTEFLLKFENNPVYESRFILRIRQNIKDLSGNESKKEYIYRIFVNGKYSRPPELAGIRMPMAPNNSFDNELEYYDVNTVFQIIPISDVNYPSGESIKTWIELYFTTALDAEIDIFSLMELFRIETSNNVISFSPRQIKVSGFSAADPQDGLDNLLRIEISGILVNSTNFGIVNFIILPGLRDNLGNINNKQIRLPLIK
ncbi:MAG: Ig-like domain-containing protein [Treponema sp.]|nr:Ig-like domain-containing protein [Treponema sp.]